MSKIVLSVLALGLIATAGSHHFVAQPGKGPFEHDTHAVVVIDNEDATFVHQAPIKG